MIYLGEAIHRLSPDIFISDYVGNIVDLLENKPKLYKIIYDAQADLWLIGDGEKLIHMDMMEKAWKDGWYENQYDFLSMFVLGRITNRDGDRYFFAGFDSHELPESERDDSLISDRVDKDEDFVYSWLYCFVFVPYEGAWGACTSADTYGDDYTTQVYTDKGALLMRDFDIEDIPELASRLKYDKIRLQAVE